MTLFADTLLKFIEPNYNALNNTLSLKPKRPSHWNYLKARIQINDYNKGEMIQGKVDFEEKQEGNKILWIVKSHLNGNIDVNGRIIIPGWKKVDIKINNEKFIYDVEDSMVNIDFDLPSQGSVLIEVKEI